MDNQQNNQTPLSQEPIIQDPTPQEPINTEPAEMVEVPEPEQMLPEAKILPTEAAVPAEEYQKIIDEYKATTQPQSETESEPVQPIIETTPEPEVQSEPRVDIQAQAKSPEEQLKDLGIAVPPASGGAFLKVLFTFSLIIFIMVIGALTFVYFKTQKNSSTTDDLSSTISPTPTISSEVCVLNDKTYQIGESFASTDGCNTCSCQSAEAIVCTEKACAPTPTSVATKSATITPIKSVIKPTVVPTKSVSNTTTTSKSAVNTPDNVALTFYQEYIKQDQDSYKTSPYLTKKLIASINRSVSVNGEQRLILGYTVDDPKCGITTDNLILNNNTATVNVKLCYYNVNHEIGYNIVQVNLVTENGQWKMDDVKLIKFVNED